VNAKPKARDRLDRLSGASKGPYAKWKIGVDLARTGHYNARASNICVQFANSVGGPRTGTRDLNPAKTN